MMRRAGARVVLACTLVFACVSLAQIHAQAKTSHTLASVTEHNSQASSSVPASISSTSPGFASQPSLLITEIQYDPPEANSGRQWIEVTNTGTGADAQTINLAEKTWRLFDTVSKGTASDAHLITAYANGSTILAPGAVAVIAENPAKFLADWPHYSGILLKSAFSLNEAGTVGISNAGGTVLDAVNYTSAEGAKGDGNSLQRSFVSGTSGNGFVAGAPTPGIYANPVPAPLTVSEKMKQISFGRSTNKGTVHSNVSNAVTSSTYDSPGTFAPADSADAASAGALATTKIGALAPTKIGAPALNFPGVTPSFKYSALFGIYFVSLFSDISPILASVWFGAFLALLGFSAFSLIVLQRHYYV